MTAEAPGPTTAGSTTTSGSTTTPAIDIDHLREWNGRTLVTHDVATASKSTGLAATLDHAGDPWDGHLMPVAHWLQFNPDARQSDLGVDGHPHKGGFLPPVPLPRRMWAGSDVTFHRPIAVGESLREVQTIENTVHKSGKSGELVFLTVRHEVFASDDLATTDVQTIVYKEDSGATAPAQSVADRLAMEPADTSDWEWAHHVRPDPTMLLRYSALTFNAHRIHYDRDYAIGEEGYPGLVVHGPLSATYMVDAFMRAHPGVTPRTFRFSARSPLFDHMPVAYVGRAAATEEGTTETDAAEAPATYELATLGPDGRVCLTGTLTA
ncbi:FAS1-like dehydratase domain-containing protein [Brevibacterium litoralis]|uniref:FAS1-like dehydratase domain-containing protein n=1 Tax=Brevibacterium litoralis TaxID=3138935 RepID=UPI0032EFF1F1